MNISEQVYLSQVIVKKPGVFSSTYEFFLEDKPVAKLKKKGLGNKAELTAGNRQWFIRSRGFWKRYIEINDIQSPAINARCDSGRNFRLLFTTPDGKKYLFKRKSAWKGTWLWQDEYQQTVMEMKYVHFKFSHCGRINFYQPVTDDFYLLMLLGWFQVLTYQAHMAAAAGGAS